MEKIKKLKIKVDEIYRAKHEHRDEWADWLYENHVLLVAQKAKELSEKYGANKEIAEAAALLHDIADAIMERENPGHGEESEKLARKFLTESGFSPEETKIVIEDALKLHGCHGKEKPKSLEGRVMAAADGAVHLQSDFYEYALNEKSKDETLKDISAWALEKIDRDFKKKISFPDLRDTVRSGYEKLRTLFIKLK